MTRIALALTAAAMISLAMVSTQASAQQSLPLPHQSQMGQDHGNWGAEHGRRGPGGHGMDRPAPGAMFAQMDANHDGVVSKAEFEAFHASHRMGPPQGGRQSRPPRR